MGFNGKTRPQMRHKGIKMIRVVMPAFAMQVYWLTRESRNIRDLQTREDFHGDGMQRAQFKMKSTFQFERESFAMKQCVQEIML